MSAGRIAYLDGVFVPMDEARVSVMDRGFTFGDGVYEVTAVLDGRLVDIEPHLARLGRSLAAIGIHNPRSEDAWLAIHRELAERNGLDQGVIYLQVTRGAAERDFAIPSDARSTVVMFTQPKAFAASPLYRDGARVASVPDIRWQRRDIKSVAMIAQVLAKRAAADAGAHEAWMVEDGLVTEGGSCNAFIVTDGGAVVTRQLSNALLAGVTRRTILALAEAGEITVEERPFSLEEAMAAKEAFWSSASTFIVPVVAIDGQPVGDGKPGAVTRRLQQRYLQFARGDQ
jgi:D-alanine transaminase